MVVRTKEVEPSVAISGENFLTAIGRADLKTVLTLKTPWVVCSAEVYLQNHGFVGNGGLGVLMGDMLLQARKLGLPFVGMTLTYPSRLKQGFDRGFYQQDISQELSLEEAGFQPVNRRLRMKVRANGDVVPLTLYRSGDGLPIYGIYEPGLQELYARSPESDHRIYQQAVLGFGGAQAIQRLGLRPVVTHLNESAAVFGALAVIDQRCAKRQRLPSAIQAVRKKNLFTNHSLVPAASGRISTWQLGRYIFPNIKSEEVKDWVRFLAEQQGGIMNLGTLSMALADRLNGVSILHSIIASRDFKHLDGSQADFASVTNGIFMDRWVAPALLKYYRQFGLLDEFDLPTDGYGRRIEDVSSAYLRAAKEPLRKSLKEYLTTRQDQYGQPIQIPEQALVACWSKRFAGYKRPEMLFADINQLKELLVTSDTHVLLAGKAHSTDHPMKTRIQEILRIIDSDPVLKERVHLVQDYDELLAEQMIPGVDIWFNTPEVGKEACGTSWEKAIANLAILISTEDGGPADVKPASYLKIGGNNYWEEVRSLYSQLNKAANLVKSSDAAWGKQVKGQLAAYLSIISGSRMIRDYIELVFPRVRNLSHP